LYYISKKLDSEYARTPLHGGEVLIAVQGSVGKVAVVPPSLKNANISRTLAVIPPVLPDLAEWIALALQAPPSKVDMFGVILGSTRDSLNLRDLRNVEIRVPPLEEQRRIIERVNALLSEIQKVEEKLQQIGAIKGSTIKADRLQLAIFDKAYKGHLVPTEAELARAEGREFEDAESLLKRLANERKEMKGAQPKRPRRRKAKA
jgi:type I restriction enzyme, S subunit